MASIITSAASHIAVAAHHAVVAALAHSPAKVGDSIPNLALKLTPETADLNISTIPGKIIIVSCPRTVEAPQYHTVLPLPSLGFLERLRLLAVARYRITSRTTTRYVPTNKILLRLITSWDTLSLLNEVSFFPWCLYVHVHCLMTTTGRLWWNLRCLCQ